MNTLTPREAAIDRALHLAEKAEAAGRHKSAEALLAKAVQLEGLTDRQYEQYGRFDR